MRVRRYALDTNVFHYIGNAGFAKSLRVYSHQALSSVVLSELIRAAFNADAKSTVAELEHQSRQFVFAPSAVDWRKTGEFLARRAPKGRGPTVAELHQLRKQQNDALIAFSAWRLGYSVVTANAREFVELRRFANQPSDRLVLVSPP